jgi:hypothetical protein
VSLSDSYNSSYLKTIIVGSLYKGYNSWKAVIRSHTINLIYDTCESLEPVQIQFTCDPESVLWDFQPYTKSDLCFELVVSEFPHVYHMTLTHVKSWLVYQKTTRCAENFAGFHLSCCSLDSSDMTNFLNCLNWLRSQLYLSYP